MSDLAGLKDQGIQTLKGQRWLNEQVLAAGAASGTDSTNLNQQKQIIENYSGQCYQSPKLGVYLFNQLKRMTKDKI